MQGGDVRERSRGRGSGEEQRLTKVEIVSLMNGLAGTEVNERTADSRTALMWAAACTSDPRVAQALLGAGADGKAKSDKESTALGYLESNARLRGTDAYWTLNDARL